MSNVSINTIHAALDAGITFIDAADAYHLHADEVGHNESLIARALATYRCHSSGVLVATKGGHLRPGDGSWTVNGEPRYLKQAAEASLKRLRVDATDRRRTQGQPRADLSGVVALEVAAGDTDPGLIAAGDHRGLGAGGRRGARC